MSAKVIIVVSVTVLLAGLAVATILRLFQLQKEANAPTTPRAGAYAYQGRPEVLQAATSSATPTATPSSTPTSTASATGSPTSSPSAIPESGISWPTVLTMGLGVLVIVGAFVLAL